MEGRRIILAIALSFLVLALWHRVSIYYSPVTDRAKPAAPGPSAAAPMTATAPVTSSVESTGPTRRMGSVRQAPDHNDELRIGSSVPGNGYEMLVVLSNYGGAIRTVQLANVAEKVDQPENGYHLLKEVEYGGGEKRYSLATERLLAFVADDEPLQFDLESVKWFWKRTAEGDRQEVTFWVDVDYKGAELLRVTKTYTLRRGRSDLIFRVDVENISNDPIGIVLRQRGPIGIRQEDPRSDYRTAYAGLIKPENEIVALESTKRGKLLKVDGRTKPLSGKDDGIVWAGQTNKYFAALLAVADSSGGKIDTVQATSYSDQAELGEDLATVWITKRIHLEERKAAALTFELYLGPKSDAVFGNNDVYRQRNYQDTIEFPWCTLSWLARIMAKLLKGMYVVFRNYGLAIIVLVLLVRALMHPITKSSQMNMMRLQQEMKKLQPKMSAIKEKYKNNREAQNKATMELYKQEGVNPASQMLGCLPMMLQMPIWVALYSAMNTTFELRHQPFVLWIKDLAGPDALIRFDQAIHIPLLSSMMGPIHELNLLPLLLGVSMLVQQLVMPQPAAAGDPDQAKQQKFMFYFMAVFLSVILYNAPSGLNLYIMTSNVFGVIENRRIRRHLEEEKKTPREVPIKRKDSWFSQWAKKLEGIAKHVDRAKQTKSRK